nr:xylulose kinase-1 [Tanacetum cinerariifolium]GEZ78344.1 xylulose kinase-1 [Tanacetum cinerariifolium]
MSTSTHPTIILSDSYIEDTFSSTNTPEYTPTSPDYSSASSRNTASDFKIEFDPSEDPFKDHSAPLAISPFHDDPYIKVMQAYTVISNESPIPPQALISPPTVLSPSLNGNNKKSLRRDSKGGIIILPPVSFEEHVAVQRETKERTLLLQSLPEVHMADFHHLDDAKKIWLVVKARFGGNEESKKIRKTMLKQAFSEFSVSEEEGLHKGYDRF